MVVFWSYFRDFVGAQKIEDLTESKHFFTELFQITNRFILAKKTWGVRCTLINSCNNKIMAEQKVPSDWRRSLIMKIPKKGNLRVSAIEDLL